jgi:hypothetical protein
MRRVSIDQVQRAPAAQALLGFAIDAPRSGEESQTYAFEVTGWVLGRDVAVREVQVRDGVSVLARQAPDRPRGDIARAFGEERHGRSGFRAPVRALELEPRFSVEVVALLEDGSCERLATIAGSREPLRVSRSPRLSPVMLTTIGRSGSKWLAWLLSCHPSVLGFQPLVFEPRVGTYWTTVLRALSAPESYLRQIHTAHWEEGWWLGEDATPLPAPIELGMGEWLGAEAVAQLAALCQERVDAFYTELAGRAGKPQARYFVEKYLLDARLLDLTRECFPGAREVILVRDFRDRLSSVFAWNERRGEDGFGHDAGMSRAEYLVMHVRADAQALLDRWRRRSESAHLVRYEDLILDPQGTLAGLFAHLDVSADEQTVASVLELARASNGVLDTHRTVQDPAQTIGRWRRDLPDELAAECNELLAPVLEAFGYPTAIADREMAS